MTPRASKKATALALRLLKKSKTGIFTVLPINPAESSSLAKNNPRPSGPGESPKSAHGRKPTK
jgi:hypothetical protein